jgi:predicted neutral ceramidase superfamily lipid hydrolase
MVELAMLAFVLSFDNVRLASGLAIVEGCRRRYWHLAAFIAFVEGTFLWLGAAAVSVRAVDVSRVETVGTLVLAVALVLSLAGAFTNRRISTRWAVYVLPLLFGLDNLAAGAAFGITGSRAVGLALCAGAVSGALSLATMIAVNRCVAPLRLWWRARWQHA